MALTDTDKKDFANWKKEREETKSRGTFGISVSGGKALGFSNIPGASTYTFGFGKKKSSTIKKGKQFTSEDTDGVVTPTDGPKPTKPKPKPVTGKQATTADVEKAISAGYITPEEATGGDWGKGPALSTTYSKKSAANAAANGGTNVGKQFTGVRAGQPIPDQSNGAINYDKAPDNRPGVGAVNLDDIK
jgi:hypothetical protein